MNEKRVYQIIGICNKARKLVTGEFAVKQAVQNEQAYLVIVTSDASDNTKKLFKDKTSYRHIKYVEWGKREEMGHILGKEERVAIAILDENFAKQMYMLIENDG